MFIKVNLATISIFSFILGTVLTFCGFVYKTYPGIVGITAVNNNAMKKHYINGFNVKVLNGITGVPLLKEIRDRIAGLLSVVSKTREEAQYKASVTTILIIMVGILNYWLLKNIGRLWYTRVLVLIISLFLPYYIVTLIIDLHKNNVNKQVPMLIDEFRGAFLKHGRIKPALLESSKLTGGSLGEVVERAVLSTDVTESLRYLKASISNVWFGVFVQLLINYKANGGELIDQLYKLNKTMVLYNNLEKKKSKRLIWYEIFAISVAVISIPIIYWVNYKILGSDGFIAADAKANLTVSRIIGLSIFSLLVIRILRKL